MRDFSDSENVAPCALACNSQTNLGKHCSDIIRNIFICSSSMSWSSSSEIKIINEPQNLSFIQVSKNQGQLEIADMLLDVASVC